MGKRSRIFCEKCGGSDFREGHGKCWTCKLARARERKASNPAKYRPLNAKYMREYRAKNKEYFRQYSKKRRETDLAKNPHMDRLAAMRKRPAQLEKAHNVHMADIEASRRKNIPYKAKSDREARLRELDTAFKRVMEIALADGDHGAAQHFAAAGIAEALNGVEG